MTQNRKRVPAAVQRALKEEADNGCAIPGCPYGHPQKCHIIDHQYVNEHKFGGMINMCGAHHDEHTYKDLKNLDLYIVKAKRAYETDRYTATELIYLEVFTRLKGSYFLHPVASLCCLARLIDDGYIEEMSRRVDEDGVPQAMFRLTRYGRGLTAAWVASGSPRIHLNPTENRWRPPRGGMGEIQ
ncbi:hypothetical protein ACIP2Y_18525 [Streptomyces sviceus]|uniref:hypothetical protein n=1 Tax=Streptomyces sviceus TaxID=285530 RepID=UPI003823698A